jgi:hypothetical protein
MIPPWKEIRRKRGQSCVGSLFVAAAVIMLAWIGWNYYLYKTFEVYASSDAVVIPAFDGGAPMYEEALQKVAAFQTRLKAHEPATLTLNGDEINTIIARLPKLEPIRGQIYFSLQGSQGLIQFSVPYNRLIKFFATKRYVNGGAYFTVGYDPAANQLLAVFQGVRVNGEDLSPRLRDEAASHFNHSIQQNMSSLLLNFSSTDHVQVVTIQNGQLVIQAR